MDTKQPEAMQLADDLDAEAGRITQYTNRPGDLLRELAATELRRLHAENAELQSALASQAQPSAQAQDAARVFWQQHTQADALSMTMAELHDDVELVIRAARGAAQAAECGNCFEGKSDMDHDCCKCGGTGAAQALDAREKLRTDVARAIWEVMREYEDSCDLELEDIGCSHVIWQLANAAIAAKQGGAA